MGPLGRLLRLWIIVAVSADCIQQEAGSAGEQPAQDLING